MKVCFVAGFFEHVLAELENRFAGELKNRSIIWVPQLHRGGADPGKFKRDYFDRVGAGATDVLVLLSVLRGYEFNVEIIKSVIEEGKVRNPALNLRLVETRNARNIDLVTGELETFGVVGYDPRLGRIPATLDDLRNWVTRELKDKLMLHPRALRGASKSRFADIQLIYRSLLLLGIQYRDRKLWGDGGGRRLAFETTLNGLGVELNEAIDESAAGQYGDMYYVAYPIGSEKKRLLSHHVKKGSDRDQQFCLRIYFFWDQETGLVIVGWLPSHLDTEAT